MFMGSSFRFWRLVVAAAVAVAVMISAGAGAFFTIAQANSVPDKPTGLVTLAGDTQVQLNWDDPDDSSITSYELWQHSRSAMLTGVAGAKFGYSVAVSGDIAVVGMPEDDYIVSNSGAALVYSKVDDLWTPKYKLKASDADKNDKFGNSVAIDGGTIVVGAPGDESKTGSAYIFTKSGEAWGDNPNSGDHRIETAKLTASGGAVGDEFGWNAVAVDGDTVVVGAYGDDGYKGAAYVFTKPAGGWGAWDLLPQTGTNNEEDKDGLTAKLSGGAAGDEFGISVAVDGGTVVVGGDQDGNGAAYVYTKPATDGGWADSTGTETAKLTASDGAAGDEFGISVAVDGETVLVGGDQDGNGAAYVYTKPATDGGWADSTGTETAKLTASDGAAGDEFGISVAVDGETVLVGGDQDGNGAAYVYTKPATDGGWADSTGTETAKLTASDGAASDKFGSSVTIDTDTVVVGVEDRNAAYVFGIKGWTSIDDSDGTTTSHTVTGLTNDIEHTFRLRAVSSEGGAGPPSDTATATPVKPKPAKPTGLSAAAGDTQVKLSWNDPDDESITKYELWQHSRSSKLTAPIREAYDEFGYAVAMDGDTAVVGMPGGDDGGANVGVAFVFTRDQDTGVWSRMARLRASDPDDSDTDVYRMGLSVAVHEDITNGDTIVVGAPYQSDSNGAVYVFSEPTTGWANTTATAKFLASDQAKDDQFGISLAVDGNTIVVGTAANNAAYIFTKAAGPDWANDENEDHTTETVKLSGSGSFGKSVAIDGDTILVGATGNKGSAFVFIKPATGWANSPGTERAKLTASSREDDDLFGKSVAIDGDTILVGATGHDGEKGSAFVFIKPATGWANSPGTERAKLTASARSANDQFGSSVAVDGDTVVVGADALNATRPGSAYVFTKPATGWADSTETAQLSEADLRNGDRFGISVAVSGVTVMVGSNGQGNDEGAAYLYDILGWNDIDGSTAATTSHFVTGLSNDVHQTFAVRGVNINGVGPPAQGSETPEAANAAPVKPRNFSAVQTGGGAVLLEWGQIAYPLTIAGYQYKQNEDEWADVDPSNSTTVSHLVSGLTGENTFAIRAVNNFNDFSVSVASHSRSVTIVAAPTAVATGLSAVPGDRQVQLSWSLSGVPGSITGFQYRHKTGDKFGDKWTDITGSTPGTTSHIVTGLANGKEYTFQVRAVGGTIGSAATGPEDGGSNSATPTAENLGPEDQPSNLGVQQTGVGQVELTWTKSLPRLAVTGYQYRQDDVDDEAGVPVWIDIEGSHSGTESHTVTGLIADNYTFELRAINSGGESNPSNALSVTLDAKPNRPTGLGAEDGDTQATVKWRLPPIDPQNPALIDKYQLLQVPLSKLTARVPGDNDEFGYSVAVDEDIGVVGAPGATNGTGAAYVYTKDSRGVWSQAAMLAASDGLADDGFGISVAVDGDTIVVGALRADYVDSNDSNNNVTDSGVAYVFTEPNTLDGRVTTNTAATLTASSPAAGDKFGLSVAVDENTVVVGGDQNGNGAVYVFTKPDTDGWAGTIAAPAQLTATDGAANDELGISVAMDGDTVVVGAHQRDANGDFDVGGAYVFTKTGIDWATDTETAKLTAADGALNDKFGNSVAIEGDTVVVGAHQHDADGNADAGGAYIFDRDQSSGIWSQGAKLTASDAEANDAFGISVALDGDKAVVGAHMDDNSDLFYTNSGSVYVFTREPDAWSETVKLEVPVATLEDRFGYSVALSGGTVLAGAPKPEYRDSTNTPVTRPGLAYAMDVAGRTDAKTWTDVGATELTEVGANYNYRVTGLNNDQEYAFRVRSVNAIGNNPSAETLSATPLLTEPDRPTGLTAVAGSRRVNLSWDRSYDSSIDGYQALTLKIDKLTASNSKENDNFGWAVAMDDGTAVVGAPRYDGYRGAAYVFARNTAGAWSQVAKLTALDSVPNDKFGYSVAAHGDTIVVGAPQDDDKGDNSGAAYVFTKPATNGGWADSTGTEPAKFTASDGALDDEFGHSVAVDGDTVVVGAHQANLEGTGNTPINNSGAAYVFTKPPLGWATGNETAKLTESVSGRALHDRFGQSVAVQSTDDGDIVVVGAHLDEGNGSVFVFTEPGSGWASGINETAKLTASDGMAGDQFGYSVALDGTTLVVGARQGDSDSDSDSVDSGSAYVFTEPDTMDGWKDWNNLEDADEVELTAKLTASDGKNGDDFGYSVAVNGDTVVVGAYNDDNFEDDDDSEYSGSAYIFAKPDTDSGWARPDGTGRAEYTETAKVIAPDDDGAEAAQFGNSVAIDSESIIVGAPFDDVVVEDNQEIQDAGSMYASGIPQWTPIDPSNDTTTSHTVYDLTKDVEYTFQVRAVDEAGSSPPSNIVHATPRGSSGGGTEPRNYGPSFVSGNNLTPAVDENAPPGTLVGSPITATDPEDDDLTYYLQGDDAFSFGIVAETGQLTVKDPLDYESKSVYQVTVRVNDGENSSVVVDVDITVNNVDEIGTISLSSQQAKVGTALTAEVSDPDGSVTGVTWQWASSPDLVNWQNIAGATSTTYTPVAQDMDRFLRVTVSYADGEGSGKQEQFNFSVAVQGLPVPTPTPAPEPPERDERPTPGPRSTPEPTAAPTVKPTRVAERPAVPRPEAMARPTPETSGIPMPETGAIFVPEPTLLPTPALAPVGTPVLAQNPTAIPTPTTAPAPATPQVAPDDEGGVNGWLITLLVGGAVAIAAGTFFVVWIRG